MSGADSLKVLIVDDEEIVRHILKEFLLLMGHQVEEAKDGLTGYQLLESNSYDAVFADMRMPGIDGSEFLARCKVSHPALPIFIISGHGTDDMRHEVLSAGAQAFLSKPFSFKEVCELVTALSCS